VHEVGALLNGSSFGASQFIRIADILLNLRARTVEFVWVDPISMSAFCSASVKSLDDPGESRDANKLRKAIENRERISFAREVRS
jgi:hypothetical protein